MLFMSIQSYARTLEHLHTLRAAEPASQPLTIALEAAIKRLEITIAEEYTARASNDRSPDSLSRARSPSSSAS
jgi:hypothetical protein